jgi:hypothetical protein
MERLFELQTALIVIDFHIEKVQLRKPRKGHSCMNALHQMILLEL